MVLNSAKEAELLTWISHSCRLRYTAFTGQNTRLALKGNAPWLPGNDKEKATVYITGVLSSIGYHEDIRGEIWWVISR